MVRMAVSAFIPDTAPNLATDTDLEFASLGVAGQQTARLQRRYGGPWVVGNLSISDSQISFRPNDLSGLLRGGHLELDIRPLDLVSVSRRPGFMSTIVDVAYGPGGTVRTAFRCLGSKKLAAALQCAADSARTPNGAFA